MCCAVLQDRDSYTASPELRASIARKNKHRIASKFSFLVTQLRKRFEVLEVNPVDLRTFLTAYSTSLSRKDFAVEAAQLDTLALIFDSIAKYSLWDYLNFDLAGSLVEHFTQQDQICVELLADYQRDFTGYLLTTEIVHHIAAKRGAGPTATPPESIPSEELCSKLTVKLAIDITTHSLKYVEEVWKTLLRRSQLPKHTLLLRDIAESSLMITWLFPKSKATELADAILRNAHELQLKKAFSVTIDEFELLQMDILSADDELDINKVRPVSVVITLHEHIKLECSNRPRGITYTYSTCNLFHHCRLVLVQRWWQLLLRAMWIAWLHCWS